MNALKHHNGVGNRIGSRLMVLVCSTVVLLALAGCAGVTGHGDGAGVGGSGMGGSGSSGTITGDWQLVSGTDAKGAITPGTAAVTFTVNGASSGGHGPCNSFGATVHGTTAQGATAHGATAGAIRIVVGIHTNIACMDPELNATEARYFSALNAVTKAARGTDTLTLSGGGDTLVFTRAKK